jgi:PAS domain S-box-containing protein
LFQLPASLQAFSDISNRVGTGILFLNKAFEIIAANKKALHFMDREAHEVHRISLFQLVSFTHLDGQSISESQFLQTIKKQKTDQETGLLKMIVSELDELTLVVDLLDLQSDEHELYPDIHVALVMRDMSNSMAEQENLIRREEQFRLIFENSPAGICFYDQDGTILQVNDEFSFIIGASRERLVGLNMIRDLSNQEVVIQVKKSLEKKLGYYEGFYTSVTAGKTTFVRCFFNPVLGEKNEFIGGVCLVDDLTESQLDKQRIEYLYANLNGVVESSQDVIMALDKQGNYVFFNSRHVKLLQEVLGDVDVELGQNLLSLLPDTEQNQRFKKALDRVFSGENIEARSWVRVGEEDRYYLTSMYPVKTEQNEIVAASIFMRDITAEHEIGKKIRENEQLLNSITSNLSEAVYRSSRERGIIYANDAFYKMFGYKKGDVVTNADLFLVYESVEVRTQFLEEIDQKKHISNREMQMRRLDGTRFWALLNVTKTISDDGIFYDGVITDITDKKRQETELRTSEESYKKLFENASEPIYILDKDYCFLDLNAAACAMYDMAKSDLIGKKPQFTIDSTYNNPKLIQDMLRKAFKGIPQSQVIYGFRKNGAVFPKKIRLQKSRYFGKEVVIAFVEDITQSKQLEDERNRLIADLTRQNRDLQHFSYVISHDLRSPVANILSLSSIFELDNLDEYTKNKIVEGLKISAQNLDKTIKDLNEVLSIRNDVHSLKEPVRFQEIMMSVQTALAKQIQQSNAIITYDFSMAFFRFNRIYKVSFST